MWTLLLPAILGQLSWSGYFKAMASVVILTLGPWTGCLWMGYMSHDHDSVMLQLLGFHYALLVATVLAACKPDNFMVLLIWLVMNFIFVVTHWVTYAKARQHLDTLQETKDYYAAATLADITLIIIPAFYQLVVKWLLPMLKTDKPTGYEPADIELTLR